jgi:hypothetical protein
VREHDFKLLGERAVDLSQDGMLLVSDVRVLTGEEVLVSFRLPTTSQWIDAEATVARVVHGRRPWDTGRCLGLKFEGLDEGWQWLIRGRLRGIPPPLPRRDPRIDYAASIQMAALSPELRPAGTEQGDRRRL